MGSGTDDFAGLLSSLKERSGLSYGVLAKRLHVGTSTLHRYVRGESVPTEYGTIEKFARLTGATAAEMAELYRLWMAAVEGRASSAPSTPEAPQDAPTVSEPDPEPSRRRLFPALAVVAVLGVGAAVAGVAFAGSGSSPRPASGGAPRSAPSSTDSSSTSTPGSSSTSTSSPISSATSSPASTPASSTSSSPSPATLPPPISVDIRPYQWEDKCNQWYLLNRKPSEVPPPPTEQDARGWAKALGAVPAGTMKLELAVQGTSGDTVVLHSLHVRTMSKAAALPWSAYSMASGCGGGLTPASFTLNLDVDRPLARPTPGQQGDTVIPAVDFPFKVSKTDPQVLTLYAHATSSNVSWYLELDWSSGDRSGTLRIDDHGRPFQTSGAKGRPLYGYNMDTSTWEIDDTATLS
ncbi:MAG: helix-turn-helix domain-containing protein [Catenulispora sp.]|nr:helix-turn-helix domain-containing protein [Catenulispora sp.]